MWGWNEHTQLGQSAALIVAELAANAIMHGTPVDSPGVFRLRLALLPATAAAPATLRIEVADSRTVDSLPDPGTPPLEAISGRGLLLVAALADSWGHVHEPPSGKRVWAELGASPEAI